MGHRHADPVAVGVPLAVIAVLDIAPVASAKPCVAHKDHQPSAIYQEEHHVIPRAWQYVWHPGDEHAVDGQHSGRLFDPRTVALCPTGHRNVHWWLVVLMKQWQAIQATGHKPSIRKITTLALRERRGHSRNEFKIARWAIERWTAAGGKPDELLALRLYGEI